MNSDVLRHLPAPHGVVFLLGTVVGACLFPSESGGGLTVQLDSIPAMIVGESFGLDASVFDREQRRVRNVRVIFATDDAGVADIVADTLIARGSGTVVITATVLGTRESAEDLQVVRVSPPVAIDNISPSRPIRWGETLRITGVGLATSIISLNRFSDPGSPGIPAAVKDSASSDRFDSVSIWIPTNAPDSSRVLVVRPGIGSAVSEHPLLVVQEDLFETAGDSVPTALGAVEQFTNPSLALEPLRHIDWYTFENAVSVDRTIILRWAGNRPDSVVLSNAFGRTARSEWAVDSDPTAWATGSHPVCSGRDVPIFLPPADSTVFALANLDPGTYHLAIFYLLAGSYSFRMTSDYTTEVPSDSFEENDHCLVAGNIGNIADTLPGRILAGLTFDNVGDLDWFTLSVTDSIDLLVKVNSSRTGADPNAWLLTVDDLDVVAQGTNLGQEETILERLGPGDYFLLIADVAGVPTEYSLCVGTVKSGACLSQ